MADRVPIVALSKEVLPPQKQSSGLGVMVVASMIMLMAVASSAFVLRARMAQEPCLGHGMNPAQAHQIPRVEWPLELPQECGTPIYQQNPDGSVSVFFDVCPESRQAPWNIRSADTPNVIEVEVR